LINEKSWTSFWTERSKNIQYQDDQTQVLRTYNGEPISNELWQFTLAVMEKHIQPQQSDIVLELCCGNALISRFLSSKVNKIYAVDISIDLLNTTDRGLYPNIQFIHSDIRCLDFEAEKFDKIVFYAGVQYLTHGEAVILLEQLSHWLKPKGLLFIGDIPDSSKRWTFYNNASRKSVYFDNIKNNTDVVGTWFEKEFFEHLTPYTNFQCSAFIEQHPSFIYSHFRFDYIFTK